MSAGKILVYGGRGALGAACISHFKANNYWVTSIDVNPNDQADVSIVVPRDGSWMEQESEVTIQLSAALDEEKLDGIVCVAGGWVGGNAEQDLVKKADLMWRQSVWTSTISASAASHHLKNGGILTLTGARPALRGTPGMVAYGMAKAAVHQLTLSLAERDSGLPAESIVVSILPVTLDTPMNRQWMPEADTTAWTPLTEVAELFLKWIQGKDRPKNGALLELVTKDSKTKLTAVELKDNIDFL